MIFYDQQALNDGWRFALTEAPSVEALDFDDSAFAAVTLPHDWQLAQPRDPDMELGWSQGYVPRDQLGWYRLRFVAPRGWGGKVIRLVVDGCHRFYSVYLNGRLVAERKYGYLPLMCELQGLLRCGEENLLCVRVDNRDTLGDRWYSGAGLYRGVRLLVDEPAHIAPWGVCVRTTFAGADAAAHVGIELENRLTVPVDTVLRARLTDREGSPVADCHQQLSLEPGRSDAQLTLPVSGVRRWDVDDPYLYRLELTLTRDGETLDCVGETVGFREAVFDGDRGFLLNGRALKLYGANLHHDGGLCFGAAVPDGLWDRRLRQLQKMGCNAIRCSHNPREERFYDLCDELGLVVIDEVYDKWRHSDLYYEKLFDTDRELDLQWMVRRDRNHPSIVLWSMGNEVEIQYTDEFYTLLADMCGKCRALDPTRQVSLALIGFCLKEMDDRVPLLPKLEAAIRYGEVVDVFMGNYMEPFYQAMRDAGMRKAIIGSEVFSYYRTAEHTSMNTRAISPWLDVERAPWVAGGFVWAGVDYMGEAAAYPSHGWTGCPIDSAGFWKLRAWHLYSQWSRKPVVKLGVFDENDPWDMANANWSFPQMSGHWSFSQEGRMMHVVVMTNCDAVRLYLNDEPARVATPDAQDRMAHFYVPFRKGTLRAEGLRLGEAVGEDTLKTADGPCRIALSREETAGLLQVEARLLDEHGQLWTKDSPEVTFIVADGELLGVDNGDFVGDHDTRADHCPFHLGHAIAYVRPGASCTVSAACGDWRA